MNPHYYSLKKAAEVTGKAENTIRSAIRKGRISCVEQTNSGYKIDPAELHRVFPAVSNKDDIEGRKSVSEKLQFNADINRLQLELNSTLQRLQDKEQEIARLQGIAEGHMRLLKDHSEQSREERRQRQHEHREAKERIRELEERLDRVPRTVWGVLFGQKGHR